MGSLRNAGCRFLAGTLFVTTAGLGTPTSAATKLDDSDRPYWRTNLFKRVFTDQRFLLTRWLPHELKDPLFVCTLGVGVAVAVQSGSQEGGGFDLALESGVSGDAGPGVRSASHILTTAGEGVAAAAILGITYLSSRHAHDDRLSEASSLAAESLLNAGIWVTVLKTAAARVRPNNPDAGRFFQYGRSQSNSFPSGHAMGAFSVASVFAASYRDKRWVPWLSYGLATLVSASRLELGRHFPSDLFVGAVLGASIGRGVVARNREENSRMRGTLGPMLGPDRRGIGVGWSYSWK